MHSQHNHNCHRHAASCRFFSLVAASLLTLLSCSKSVKIRLVATWYLQTFASSLWIRSQLSICSKPFDNLLETCYIKPEQVMRTYHDIGLMTEACSRLAANYAFLAVYSHIIIINVNYIKMLMQLTSITLINILTMFVSQFVYSQSVVQRITNNVDACTQCAYLFFVFAFLSQKKNPEKAYILYLWSLPACVA